MRIFRDMFNRARDSFRLGMAMRFKEFFDIPNTVKGEVFFEMRDNLTGELLYTDHKKNLITLDAGILLAILCRDKSSRTNGLNMLAVGTGATGALLNPNAPDNRQRKLNAEIARKPFSSTVFRDGSGNAVAYPTNIVDFTASFGEGEAVGPWTEMGILSTISNSTSTQFPNPNTFPTRNTTVDLSLYDILINYLPIACCSKPSTATITITWRLTF